LILLTYRKVALGLILTVSIIAIMMFDTVFHLLLELIHASFELLEFSLDLLVEHIFETGRHETQIIVFYLMWFLAGCVLYRLYKQLRALLRRSLEFKEYLVSDGGRLKKEISAYWRRLSATGKAKWSMSFMTSFIFMVFWLFI
jgi:hypothetical protein